MGLPGPPAQEGAGQPVPGGVTSNRKLTIAIEGCCHGELDNIYATLQYLEKKEGRKVDLLISCGDFQAVRNMDDLQTMACPAKYRDIQTFYKYYSGEKVAPIPTLFIGGNHEASNHLWELYYGGWAAPNIRFLGFAGCIKFGGYRIAGLSGIYKQGDYARGHNERLPYSDSAMRSIYHIRDFEVYRLMQLKQPVDVFLSHDWPRNIAGYGNKAALLSKKPFLREEIESGELGSPAGESLLHTLKPSYWFSAHLHTKYAAIVPHPPSGSTGGSSGPVPATASSSADALRKGSGGGTGTASTESTAGGTTTRFLALDKCLPRRDFLQVIELDARCEGPPQFEYDEEWLAIMRTTHGTVNLTQQRRALPGMGGLRRGADPRDVEFVRSLLAARPGGAVVPNDFVPTATAHDPSNRSRGQMPTRHVRSPQTEALLQMLGLPYNLDHDGPPTPLIAVPRTAPTPSASPLLGATATSLAVNPEEIDLGDEDEEAAAGGTDTAVAPDDVEDPAVATADDGMGDDVISGEEDEEADGEGGSGGTAGGLSRVSRGSGGTGGGTRNSALEDDPMFQSAGL